MRTPDGARPEVITAKWKTALDSNEEHFGTITLDDAFELTLPILHSFADIPSGTTLLWGVTDNNQIEHLFNASRAIRHLLIGQKHINDPTGDFVTRIAFTPKPNEDLRKLSFDSAPTELFEMTLRPDGMSVSAWVAGGLLGFCLLFQGARTLNAALEETNVLLICVFLSFLAHQYI